MGATIIDGRRIAEEVRAELRPRIAALKARGVTPGLAAVIVGDDPGGKHVVILGRSNIVGKPLAALLVQKAEGANATVTVCHSATRDLPAIAKTADILVAAIGRAEFVTAAMVRPGTVVIDVGINRVPDATKKQGFRTVGDVRFSEVVEVASAITPVPGGVGPMTIAMLLSNTVRAAESASH